MIWRESRMAKIWTLQAKLWQVENGAKRGQTMQLRPHWFSISKVHLNVFFQLKNISLWFGLLLFPLWSHKAHWFFAYLRGKACLNTISTLESSTYTNCAFYSVRKFLDKWGSDTHLHTNPQIILPQKGLYTFIICMITLRKVTEMSGGDM